MPRRGTTPYESEALSKEEGPTLQLEPPLDGDELDGKQVQRLHVMQ